MRYRQAIVWGLLTCGGNVVSAADLAAGWTHSVAVQEGRVWTWGDNAWGQLGQPDAGRTLRPRPVAGVENVVAVAAAWHTLALSSDGRVYAWGRNTLGQLGNGRCGIDAKLLSPAPVQGLEGITAVAAGWGHSLALTRTGEVYAWGDRSHGQLGDGVRETGKPQTSPQRVSGLSDIVAIAAGGQHSLALRRDGMLFAWGSNWNGQLGNGKTGKDAHQATPEPVLAPDGKAPLASAVAIAAGALHSMAVTRDGQIFAWGYNGSGQVPVGGRGSFWGDKGARGPALPVAARADGAKKTALPSNGVTVAAGYEASYVLTSRGDVIASGWSMYGEQGDGTFGRNRDVLGPVLTGRSVVWPKPASGTWRAALVYRYTDEGHVAEGVKELEVVDDVKGLVVEVGSGPISGACSGRVSRNSDNVETQAAFTCPARAEAGQPLACLLTRLSFGTHAGDNDYATAVRLRWTNLATGESVDLPIDAGARAGASVLPPLGGIVALASGMHHVLARDAKGDLWAWGHNGFGQIGDGGVSDRSVALKLSPFVAGESALPKRPVASVDADEAPPDGRIFDVRGFGACGDGMALDQAALQRAIDACAKEGGGTVWFRPGTYLTGTLELRDGVRLHLNAGARIAASTNRDHFPRPALIYAAGVRGVAITGRGVIDGEGWFVGARDWRHYVIHMENCRDVRVEGVQTVNSGCWTEHYIRCIGLTIKGVTARSLRPGRNNDGIDLSGCENVRIEGCTVISDDDAIVIKSQSEERANRNFDVSNNVCHTFRGAFKLGTETRGAYEAIRCNNLTCYGSKALELYSVDGAEVDGVTVDHVRAYDAQVALNVRLGARLRPSYWTKGAAPKVGCLRNVVIRDVEAEVTGRAWREVLLDHGIPDAEWACGTAEGPYDSCISGLPGHMVENVSIDGLRVRVPGGATAVPVAETLPERPDIYPHAGNFGVLPAYGLFVRHAKNVTVRHATLVTQLPDARPPIASVDAPGLLVE